MAIVIPELEYSRIWYTLDSGSYTEVLTLVNEILDLVLDIPMCSLKQVRGEGSGIDDLPKRQSAC